MSKKRKPAKAKKKLRKKKDEVYEATVNFTVEARAKVAAVVARKILDGYAGLSESERGCVRDMIGEVGKLGCEWKVEDDVAGAKTEGDKR